MSECRIAVIGGGVIGQQHLATIARTADKAKAVALVDPLRASAATAEKAGLRWYPDTASLLKDGGFDAAVVASPNATHVPVALDLVDAGIPALVEKPVAETARAAIRLAEAAEKKNVPILVGHHRRHNPIIQEARSLIAAGRIGKPVVANVMGAMFKNAGYHDVEWRRQPGSGGPMLINMIHEVDLLRYIFGDITEVVSLASSATRNLEVEDSAVASVRFESGLLANFMVTDAAVSPWAWDLTAGEVPKRFPALPASAHYYCGTEGSISLPDFHIWSYPGEKSWYEPMTPEKHSVQPEDPFSVQFKHFLSVVEGNAEPLVTVRDAMQSLACVEAMLFSAKGKSGPVSPQSMLT
ncbi:Gfo/Idh/MocA family oxidoreductase [uncultured Roseibium sp.]|uniref:Gfo/Idh/MocA family protein n=1 Tax=uncultured Roseibium sp. TaxID=1936171 RepID=UPI003217D57E